MAPAGFGGNLLNRDINRDRGGGPGSPGHFGALPVRIHLVQRLAGLAAKGGNNFESGKPS